MPKKNVDLKKEIEALHFIAAYDSIEKSLKNVFYLYTYKPIRGVNGECLLGNNFKVFDSHEACMDAASSPVYACARDDNKFTVVWSPSSNRGVALLVAGAFPTVLTRV